MKKLIVNIFVIAYIICAIAVTVCLLSFNEFRVTEFGTKSLLIVDSNAIKGDFEKGSLLVVDSDEEINVGDKAFFYNSSNQNEIALAEVKNIEKITDYENTYEFEGEKKVSKQYVIGSTKYAKEYKVIGSILGILESKWGYLFGVVLPIFLGFLFELTKVFEDIKNNKKK